MTIFNELRKNKFFYLLFFRQCILLLTSTLLLPYAPVAASQAIEASVLHRVGGELGRIEALVVDPGSRVFALDSDILDVAVYDAAGHASGVLGREGGGPGEFRGPVGMTWGPDGKLWVIDPGNARVSVWDTDHRTASERPLISAMQLAPWPGRFDSEGLFYHYAPRPTGGEFGIQMVRYSRELLAPIDSLTPPEPPEPDAFFESRSPRFGTIRARIPFTARMIWRLDSQGRFVWAWTGDGVIRRTPGTAQLVRVGGQPIAVSTSERAEAIEGLARFLRLGGRYDASRIPRVKPSLRSFWLDDRDRIWVMPESTEPDAGRRLKLFDAEGRAMGTITLPIPIEPSPTPVYRNGRLHAISIDQNGIAEIIVFAIHGVPE